MANEPQQQPNTAASQETQQQPQAQAPATAQPQNNQMQTFNPLKGINLTQQLMPFANALAAPFESYMECFTNKQEGYASFHKEIEFVVQSLTAPGKPADYLRQCFMSNPLALVNAVKQVALTGLSLNPAIKESYIIPYKGVVTFMPSYVGMVDILVKTGLCSKVDAYLVYADEFFEIEHGNNEHLIHKPNPWGKHELKDVVGGYWYAVLPDGVKKFDTMNTAEINKVRAASPAANSGPWVTWTEEMMKKTLIRRAYKSLPHAGLSDEKLKVIEAVMKADDGFFFDDTTTNKKKVIKNNFFEEVQPVDAQFTEVNDQQQ